jgi:hypothetical protein
LGLTAPIPVITTLRFISAYRSLTRAARKY